MNLKEIYRKIFGIDDSPHKISMGLAIGVFFGVMPAMGPIIAFFCAAIVRVNRAAALIGGLLTNTWLTIPVFAFAVAAGERITGLGYNEILSTWQALNKNFSWQMLFKVSIFKIVLPVMLGYIVVSLVLAIIAYFITLAILVYSRSKRVNKIGQGGHGKEG